jgi:hypothetical protein
MAILDSHTGSQGVSMAILDSHCLLYHWITGCHHGHTRQSLSSLSLGLTSNYLPQVSTTKFSIVVAPFRCPLGLKCTVFLLFRVFLFDVSRHLHGV